MGINRHWTQEELAYLSDNWGKYSLKTIAKKLKRTETAVKLKASRFGLGPIKDGDGIMTVSQLLSALGLDRGWTHHKQRLVRLGLPVHSKVIITKRVDKIKLEDFWKWAEQNKDVVNWSRVEKNILGIEPAWVEERRKIHFYNKPDYARAWTAAEDDTLRYCVERGYTYQEIANKINRTSDAIRRRCYEMYLPYPKRESTRRWTQAERDVAVQMQSQGYHMTAIAEKLCRSGQSVRGLLTRIAHPEYAKRRKRNA